MILRPGSRRSDCLTGFRSSIWVNTMMTVRRNFESSIRRLKFGSSVWSVFLLDAFIFEGQLFHVLLPHIRRSLQLIQHDCVPGILVVLEELAHNHRSHGNRNFDRELDRTLRQMPLSALLSFITCRSGPFQSVVQQLAESLRLSLP